MTLEDLTRYELAAVAAKKEKAEPGIALQAMVGFYEGLGVGDDPIIKRSLRDAQEGLQLGLQKGNPTIANTGMMESIGVYGGKYEKAFSETKISDLYDYVKKTCSIPKEAEEGILKYKDLAYKDIENKFKDKKTTDDEKEELQNLVAALESLKGLKLDTRYLDLRTSNVEGILSNLYPKPEKDSENKKSKKS